MILERGIEPILEFDTSQVNRTIRVGKFASDFANHLNVIKSTVGKGRSTDCVRHKLCPPARLHLCGHAQVDRDVVHALTDEVFVANLIDARSSVVHFHAHVHDALS